jgi:hypothetical protein
MKKLLFIAFSFVLAVGLFAFTVHDSKPGKKLDQQFHWYYVTYDGSTPQIEPQEPIDYLSIDDADNLDFSCGGSYRVCKAGYVLELSFPGNVPITADTDGDLDGMREANFKEASPGN